MGIVKGWKTETTNTDCHVFEHSNGLFSGAWNNISFQDALTKNKGKYSRDWWLKERPSVSVAIFLAYNRHLNTPPDYIAPEVKYPAQAFIKILPPCKCDIRVGGCVCGVFEAEQAAKKEKR